MVIGIFRHWLMASCVLVLLAGLATLADAHQGASGIVKQRMDNFAESQKHLKSIIGYAKTGQFDEVERLAGYLASWGEQMPEYFPEGSLQKPTQARPEIWQDFSKFVAKAEIFRQSAITIGEAAALQDQTSLNDAIKNTANSCKSCHQDFRVK